MKKVVQTGRSQLLEELANPSWEVQPPIQPHSGEVQLPPTQSGEADATSRGVLTIPADSSVDRKRIRVAGYCRVSTDMESQATSIEQQRTHYRNSILANPEWELVDIYWEQDVSGTKAASRPELQRLLRDCQAGLIDMVLTKSISRFARNTADCLDMVRMLRSQGVTIVFEKENIRTDSMTSEFLLSVMAALAQDESRTISTNMKWGIRKRFLDGTYKSSRAPYGYRKTPDGYEIDPVQADVVRRIFSYVLEGKGLYSIAKGLNEETVPSPTAAVRLDQTAALLEHDSVLDTHTADAALPEQDGEMESEHDGERLWTPTTLRQLIRNVFYIGDALYQKTYMDDNYIQRKNVNHLDQYLNEDSHPALISREDFDSANALIEHRATLYAGQSSTQTRYCFSGRLICGQCGSPLYRTGHARTAYRCHNHLNGDCEMGQVFEEDIRNAFANMLNKLAFAQDNGVTFGVQIGAQLGDQLGEQLGDQLGDQICDQLDPLEMLDRQITSNNRKRMLLHEKAMDDMYTEELWTKKAALDEELRKLLQAKTELIEGRDWHGLLKYAENRGIQKVFLEGDSEAFATFVDHVVVWAKEKVEFHITGGVVFEEGLAPLNLVTADDHTPAAS